MSEELKNLVKEALMCQTTDECLNRVCDELISKHLKTETPEWKRKALAVLNVCKPCYKWIAMDRDMVWYVYGEKPKLHGDFWNNVSTSAGSRIDCKSLDLPYFLDYKESLIERSE